MDMMAANPATDIESDLELLRSSAVAAGIVAAGYFRRDVRTWTKDNASPVTEADFMVDQMLMQSLCGGRPDYGWLSEEGPDDPARLEAQRVFIVDPIDGTRAFIRGEDCWTISLAVVEDGVPRAAVVYAPARDELYSAARGAGAWLNGKRIVNPGRSPHPPVIPAPGAVHQELQHAGLDYVRGPSYASLAYRLVQTATGKLDAAVARRGAQDWDIAGAAMILEECGVGFEDVCAGKLSFNRPQTRHCALAAWTDPSLKPILGDALRRVYGCPEPSAEAPNVEHHGQ